MDGGNLIILFSCCLLSSLRAAIFKMCKIRLPITDETIDIFHRDLINSR